MVDKLLENNELARKNAREVYELARRITAEIHAEHHRPAIRFTLEPGEPGIFESKAGVRPTCPMICPGRWIPREARLDCWPR